MEIIKRVGQILSIPIMMFTGFMYGYLYQNTDTPVANNSQSYLGLHRVATLLQQKCLGGGGLGFGLGGGRLL